jgi:hypothetical protein
MTTSLKRRNHGAIGKAREKPVARERESCFTCVYQRKAQESRAGIWRVGGFNNRAAPGAHRTKVARRDGQ